MSSAGHRNNLSGAFLRRDHASTTEAIKAAVELEIFRRLVKARSVAAIAKRCKASDVAFARCAIF